jgi:L-fuconolactonase
MTIDTHQHFWRYDAQQYGWIKPGMDVLMQDYLPVDLQPLLHATGVEGTILVQARPSLAETEWLLALAAETPFVKGVVGWADLRDPALFDQLEKLTVGSKLAGIRYSLASLPADFMLSPEFMGGLDVLHNFGLVFDLHIRPQHLQAAFQVARRFPSQRFVVDHLATPPIKQGALEPWAAGMRQLAQAHNVFCKLSGMVTEADWTAWQAADMQPYLDVVFEAFGPSRLMFGSDWPVCTLAAPYERVLAVVSDYILRCSRSEQKLIMSENARQVYFYYQTY